MSTSKTAKARQRRERRRVKQELENRLHVKIYAGIFLIAAIAGAILLWVFVGQVNSPLRSPHPGIVLGVVVSSLLVMVYGLCLLGTITSSRYRRGETNGIERSWMPWRRL